MAESTSQRHLDVLTCTTCSEIGLCVKFYSYIGNSYLENSYIYCNFCHDRSWINDMCMRYKVRSARYNIKNIKDYSPTNSDKIKLTTQIKNKCCSIRISTIIDQFLDYSSSFDNISYNNMRNDFNDYIDYQNERNDRSNMHEYNDSYGNTYSSY
jgi:hypothetical protein